MADVVRQCLVAQRRVSNVGRPAPPLLAILHIAGFERLRSSADIEI